VESDYHIDRALSREGAAPECGSGSFASNNCEWPIV
jgi:hypothetical protein